MSDRDVSTLPKLTRDALFAEYNDLVDALGVTGCILHTEEAQSGDTISVADATDEATTITLSNAIKADLNTHLASTVKHVAADATNPTTEDDATDQTTINTLVNALKDDLDAHQILTASHRGTGGPGSVTAAPIAQTAADATDAATSVTLVNALKALFNLHVQSGAQNLTASGN